MMLSYAVTLVNGDYHLAEDVVQDSCLVAYRNLERFDVQRGSFSRWLRGIVRNKVLESNRKISRAPFVHDPLVIEGMEEVYGLFDQPGVDAGWRDRLEIIHECIHKLKESMRTVVLQFYYSGNSLREISEKQSINVMTVGQRLSRSRKLIRVCVEQKLGVE